MKQVKLILFLLILNSMALIGTAQPAKNRDLAKYDSGGAFEFSVSVAQQKQDTMRGQVREFVWNHWARKRRGHIQITFWSAAEDPSTYDLFIEPDRGGKWQVASEYKRQCCIERTQKDPKIGIEFNTGTLYYMRLERRAALPGIVFLGEDMPLDTPVYGKPVAINAKRSGRSFVLLFRNEKQGQADWIL